MINRNSEISELARFDASAFVEWCRERWRFCALASIVAVGVTAVVSIALPKQFTANATILIGAPAGNDPRATTAMNSVYLDSLRAWERVAGSDFLFAQALETVRAGGNNPAGSVSSLKRKILKVTKPSGMALLEISITLPDAKKAQGMAQIIAEQTVAQSRSSDERSATDLNGEFREQRDAAALRVVAALKARDALTRSAPIEVLQSDVTSASQLSGSLQTEIAMARADLAGDRAAQDLSKLNPAEARLASLEKQQKDAAEHVVGASARLEAAKNLREAADAELKSARAALDTSNLRVNEALSTAKFRGERLRIVDPGAIPQEPSSPNVLLNSVAALFTSLGLSVLYLAVSFGLRRDAKENSVERLYSLR